MTLDTQSSMKIIMCIPTLTGGGAERQVCDLADELTRLGHEVIIYCLRNEQTIAPVESSVRVVSGNLNKSPKKAIFSLIKEMLVFRKFVKQEQADIVHGHLFHANIFSRLAVLFLPKIKQISTLHSSNTGSVFRENVYKLTNIHCDLITAVSQVAIDEHAKISRSFITKSKVVYNGIPLTRFKQKEQSSKKELSLLAAGRLVTEKNFDGLIRAFDEVSQMNPNATLTIAGEGEKRGELEALIQALSLSNKVHLIGFQHDLPSLMANFDYFVLSSNWEGFGLVVAEVMWVGLPVLATDCGGVKEVMAEPEFLIPKQNHEALVDGLHRLLSLNENDYKAIQARGRRTIEQKFAMHNIAKQWENIYSDLLAGKPL